MKDLHEISEEFLEKIIEKAKKRITEKDIKIIKNVFIIIFIIVFSISFVSRYCYGTWNVFAYPNRVIYGRYYYENDTNYIVTISDNDLQPKHDISKMIDKIYGKRFYCNDVNFIPENGGMVYMHLRGDKYLVLFCGGEPPL